MTNPDAHAERALTVSAFNAQARRLVEEAFQGIWIEGELSNFKQHTSGHCYFSLKDDQAQIRGVMWRGNARGLYFTPTNGMLVQAYGNASLYEPRGDFQVVVKAMRLAGEGGLQKAFEALKQKLYAEGLFEAEHKQPLPSFPSRIAIVTSGDGAALHDILTVLNRRYPLAKAMICPTPVQGPGAAQQIADTIEALNRHEPAPDVMIVGRGGGSAEDLWAFNEEIVARAIFASLIPVISAVGHETDVTIADYVADRRAATPTMAAEIVAPDLRDLAAYIRHARVRMHDRLQGLVAEGRRRLDQTMRRYGLQRPADLIHQYKQRTDELDGRLQRNAKRYMVEQRNQAEQLSKRLNLLDPNRPLERGFALIEKAGKPIHEAKQLGKNDPVTLIFSDGRVDAKTTSDPQSSPEST